MTTQNVNLSDNDEDFVSCQICMINFDDKERVPKFLQGCYHYFCLLCIKVGKFHFLNYTSIFKIIVSLTITETS